MLHCRSMIVGSCGAVVHVTLFQENFSIVKTQTLLVIISGNHKSCLDSQSEPIHCTQAEESRSKFNN